MSWDVYRGTHDAATSLAIDDILLDRAADGTRSVRVYDFERPAVILARNESADDVREWRDDIDYTRRDTGGSVIYCDDTALFYSIAAPTDSFPEEVHRDHFGPRIARGLADVGVPRDRLGVGEHFSVRIDGGTVAGNSQRKADGAVLYHGVLAVEPWDVDTLDDLIALRERDGQRERDYIADLPALVDHVDGEPAAVKREAADAIVDRVTGGDRTERDQDDGLLAEAERIADGKYRDDGWIRDARGAGTLKADQGFCFVDWTDEWNETVERPGFY